MSLHQGAEAVSGDIAIIGLSGQYPMADTLEEFWDVLSGGGTALRRFRRSAGITARITIQRKASRAKCTPSGARS